MEAKGDGLRGISWSAVTLDVFTSANSELTPEPAETELRAALLTD